MMSRTRCICGCFVGCGAVRMNMHRTISRESERYSNDQQRSESANPAVNYREARMSEDMAEDLSRPSSSSYPHPVHRPSAHSGVVVGAASARLPEETAASPMKLPPPAHSHHRRADTTADILADAGLRHRSPARNMPSPRGYAISDHLPTDVPPPREDVPWLSRRTVPPPLPYLPPNPSCSIVSTSTMDPAPETPFTGS